ncbi:MAG: hypothetical protein IJ535_03100 [Pseudobutyrivibrio sp.]|uniref:hypothetical protein n=1 Tax=Pseudobutyrivibrio sp. TaxID=2014367 RepID=UPI0025F9BB5A|nr:hypothetical protein [Pseudobutyrivibrio sp.]MBQ8488748.1 hypothetical protein [Pseudobutyrivibrio sp.]
MGRNNIKAIWQLKKNGEIWNLFIIVLAIVIGITLQLIFKKVGIEDEASFGDILVAGIAYGYMIINLFIKVFVLADEVPRGLSFGMTRKVLFLYSRLADLAEILFIAVIAMLIPTSLTPNTILKIAIAVYCLFNWIEATAGNGMLKFGKVVYWIYYIVFLVIMIGGPNFIESVSGAADGRALIIDMFINPFYNQLYVWLGILAFTLAGLFVNWLTFRKIPVNFSL